jgi:L-rhamnose isomerase
LRTEGHSQFHFNHSEYQRRVLDHPQRIKNLFFIYRILAKAVKEAAGYLQANLTIQSDNITQDLTSRRVLSELLAQLNSYDLS